MYEIICPDCLPPDHPAPVVNPLQRYVCPDCGYAWTQRSTRLEDALLFTARVGVLAASVAIAYALTGVSEWMLLAVGIAVVVSEASERIRSAWEDLLDPPEVTP